MSDLQLCAYLLDGLCDVSVREHNRRGLAAQLERHVLKRARGLALNDAADFSTTSEGHLGDVWVRDERSARSRTVASEDIDCITQ